MYRLDGTFFKRFTTPSHRCNTIHNDYYANLTPSPSGELIILINWEGDCSFKATIYNMNLEVDIFNPIEIPGYKINGVFWVNETSVMINTCLEYSKCVDNWMLVRDGEVTPIDNELFSSLCLAGSIVDSNINSIGEKVEWREIGSLPTITQVASYVGTEIASVTPENTRAPDSPDGCINVEDI